MTKNNSLLRSMKIMLSSSVLVQLINVAGIPILTRVYLPEDWGIYAIYLSFILIITPLISLSLSSAIVIAENDREARLISSICLYTSIIFQIVLLLILIVLEYFTLLNLTFFDIILIFVAVNLTAIHGIFDNWVNRKLIFGRISIILFISTVLCVIVSIILSFYNIGGYGLIIGNLMLYLVQIIGYAFSLKSIDVKVFYLNIYDLSFVLRVIRRYQDFPRYRLPQSFLASFSQSMPVFFISKYFGLDYSGLYNIARKMIGLPSLLIGKTIGRVYYSTLSIDVNNGSEVYTQLVRTTLILSVISLPIFVGIVFYGDVILSLLLGSEWKDAGVYAGYLSFWLYAALINKPVSAVIPIFNLQKEFFKYEIFLAVARVLAISLGVFIIKNPNITILSFSIVGFLFNLCLMFYVLSIVKNREFTRNNENTIRRT